MQISDSSSMRHTSGGLPFKLQQKKKESETDRKRKEKKWLGWKKKYFKINFLKKR